MEIAIHYTQRNNSILLKKCEYLYLESKIYYPLLGELLEVRNCVFIAVVSSRMLVFLSSEREWSFLSFTVFLVYVI